MVVHALAVTGVLCYYIKGSPLKLAIWSFGPPALLSLLPCCIWTLTKSAWPALGWVPMLVTGAVGLLPYAAVVLLVDAPLRRFGGPGSFRRLAKDSTSACQPQAGKRRRGGVGAIGATRRSRWASVPRALAEGNVRQPARSRDRGLSPYGGAGSRWSWRRASGDMRQPCWPYGCCFGWAGTAGGLPP